MKYQSKPELIRDICAQYELLSARLEVIPKSRWREPGVWGDGWTVTDLVAHLAEWQFMFLTWYEAGRKGTTPEMPAPGYKWNETPKLNRAIWARHRFRPGKAIKAEFDGEFRLILDIIEALSPEQLLTPGHFRWTGKNPLATYLTANTASHYRFALNVIDRWLKGGVARNASVKHVRAGTSPPGRPLQTGRVVT